MRCLESSAFCSSESPVVPTTAPVPWRAHAATCASVPSGRVKSISTSAAAAAASASAPTTTPVARPNRSPASRPTAGLPATSNAAASESSRIGERRFDQRLAHPAAGTGNGDPYRHRQRPFTRCLHDTPDARTALVAEDVDDVVPPRPRLAPAILAGRLREGLAVELGHRGRQLVALPARELAVDEIDGERAMLAGPGPDA